MPIGNRITEEELYQNGVFAHSLVMFAGASLMFRGYKNTEPVVFAAGAAVVVAGAYGYNNNEKEYIRRRNRRLNAN